ncbi:MAG: MFS transporter [Planctomycetes bacterium]|nr:MFS transporter [Planctomycetota bacterium]MBU4398573.1 MFS transporter [Planctomycetota bacterium]MCG2682451.1 MFS transporter [Planctomycetales bacterium]
MSEEKSLTTGQWLVLAAAFLGWMFDGVEMGLFPLVARPALQDLMGVTDDALVGQWNGYLIAAFMLGAAGGGLVFGWLGDKIGRVRGMALSIFVYSIFTGICYFATAPWQLFIFRFIAALGMGGQWALAVALVMECWPDRFRPLLAGVIGAAANVGFLLISVVGMFFAVTTDTWRIMMLAGAAPALLALLVIFFVPESERWKASVDHRRTTPMREIFKSPLLGKTLLAIAVCAVPLIATWAAVSGFLPLWADQLAGKENPHAKAQVQFMLSIGAIIGCLFGSMLGHRLGRRPAYFLLCVLSFGLCFYLFRMFDVDRPFDDYFVQFMIISGLAGIVTAAFYGWAPLYLPELFPTRVRATGQGLSFNFGRIFAAGGAITTGSLMAAFGGSYPSACATITLVYVVGMVVIWFGPETKGKPLPE